jgi:hypothetical protein
VPPEKASSDISRLAGEYSFGNSFDENYSLEISADGRFLFKKSSYESVKDEESGAAKLEGNRLVLTPEKSRKTWPRGMSSVLMPISWGQRLYLVPEDDIAGFSNDVNRGTEPVSRGSVGRYYLREGDWDRPATGKPDLPTEWKERLLEKPATGKIAGRDPRSRWMINIGKDYGLYDGMELSAWSPDRRQFVTLVVSETGTDSSAVTVVDPPPNVNVYGWTVHSRITPPPPAAAQVQGRAQAQVQRPASRENLKPEIAQQAAAMPADTPAFTAQPAQQPVVPYQAVAPQPPVGGQGQPMYCLPLTMPQPMQPQFMVPPQGAPPAYQQQMLQRPVQTPEITK